MNIGKVAVVASDNLSDGLMMMVASHRLLAAQAEVVTYHNRLLEMADWFSEHKFSDKPSIDLVYEEFTKYDLILLLYEPTPFMKEIIRLFSKNASPKIAIFYPIYSKYAHPRLTPLDRVFDKTLPMVDNICLAIASLLQVREHSKNNGLLPPCHLLHRRYKKRVAIYSTPFLAKKYKKIAEGVRELGFDPLLIEGLDLGVGASLIYESGFFIGPECDLCHLASNMQIPTLVIAGRKKPFSLQKPGWLRTLDITTPRYLERFVLTRRVIKGFKRLVSKHGFSF